MSVSSNQINSAILGSSRLKIDKHVSKSRSSWQSVRQSGLTIYWASSRQRSLILHSWNNQQEQKKSFKCLSDNHYDKDLCELFFVNYTNCQKFWVSNGQAALRLPNRDSEIVHDMDEQSSLIGLICKISVVSFIVIASFHFDDWKRPECKHVQFTFRFVIYRTLAGAKKWKLWTFKFNVLFGCRLMFIAHKNHRQLPTQ